MAYDDFNEMQSRETDKRSEPVTYGIGLDPRAAALQHAEKMAQASVARLGAATTTDLPSISESMMDTRKALEACGMELDRLEGTRIEGNIPSGIPPSLAHLAHANALGARELMSRLRSLANRVGSAI